MIVRKKRFDWIATPEASLKQLPEVRQLILKWAKSRGYTVKTISYTFEEERQLLERVIITYTDSKGY